MNFGLISAIKFYFLITNLASNAIVILITVMHAKSVPTRYSFNRPHNVTILITLRKFVILQAPFILREINFK